MAKPQIDKILTGLAGEFLVAGHLCLKGYLASLTLKNYPKVDIFCMNPKNNKQVTIQVKTIRDGKYYFIPKNIKEISGSFVFVHVSRDEEINFFILPAKKVAEICNREREDYLRDRPHVKREQPLMLSIENLTKFKDRWELLKLN